MLLTPKYCLLYSVVLYSVLNVSGLLWLLYWLLASMSSHRQCLNDVYNTATWQNLLFSNMSHNTLTVS